MEITRPGDVSRTLLPGSVRGWIGDVIAVAIVAGGAILPFPFVDQRPDTIADYILVLLPALVLLFRRRYPMPALASTVVLFAAASFTGFVPPCGVLAVAICAFGVANRSRRGRGLWIGAATAIIMMAVTIPGAGGTVADPSVVQSAIFVMLGATFGNGVRLQRERMLAIAERIERAEQSRDAETRRRVSEERLRIARDLHDTVAHQIAVISLNAGVASTSLGADDEKTRQSLATIRSASKTVLSEIGSLLAMLRAEEAEPHGTAPQPGLSQLSALLASIEQAGLHVDTRIEVPLASITGATDLTAYWVIQEALTNALKHGAEARAHLLISVTSASATIVITNPLPADAVSGDQVGSRLGLIGLRERVASVGGTLTAGPGLGGWRLSATLPLTNQEHS